MIRINMVCMTWYFILSKTIVYADASSFICFDDAVKHCVSLADGFGYESFEENVFEFLIHNWYQG